MVGFVTQTWYQLIFHFCRRSLNQIHIWTDIMQKKFNIKLIPCTQNSADVMFYFPVLDTRDPKCNGVFSISQWKELSTYCWNFSNCWNFDYFRPEGNYCWDLYFTEREREKYSQNFVISLLVAMVVPVLVSVSLRLWNLLCSWMYLLLSYSALPGHHEHVRQLGTMGASQ